MKQAPIKVIQVVQITLVQTKRKDKDNQAIIQLIEIKQTSEWHYIKSQIVYINIKSITILRVNKT